MNNWKLHILSDDFFGCEWLHTGKLHIYTFGDRCQPVRAQTASTLANAKIWVSMFGERWLNEQGKHKRKAA